MSKAMAQTAAPVVDWGMTLLLAAAWLAFCGFVSYMAIKQEDEDRKAGRPKRLPPEPLL